MKLIKRIKEDWTKVKDLPSKEKWEFFWDYYKVSAICILVLLFLLVQGIRAATYHRDIAFSGIFLNCGLTDDEGAFLDGFYEQSDIDPKSQTAAFYSDMCISTAQGSTKNNDTINRIIASISVQDTDVISGDPYSFQICAYNSSKIFVDLREFLDAETLKKYADRLYYVDASIVALIDDKSTNLKTVPYPEDPKNPENMEIPIPVGIDVSDCDAFFSTYYNHYTEERPVTYIGVVRNTLRPELAKQFLEYLLK